MGGEENGRGEGWRARRAVNSYATLASGIGAGNYEYPQENEKD